MKRIKLKNRYSRWGILFLLPGLLGFLIFVFVPILLTVYYSFVDASGSFAFFNNYISLFQSQAFLLALQNTGLYLLIGGGLVILLSFLLAWGLYTLERRKMRGATTFKVAFLLPMVIPTAVSVLFAELLFSASGAVNRWLGTEVDWLTTSPYTFWILVLLYIWKNFGYFVIIFLAAFSRIEPEVYEAARSDGAGTFLILTRIVIPQITASSFFVFIMSIIGVFKMYRESYLLFGDYPSNSAYMFQNFISNNIAAMDLSRAAASAMILFVVFAALVIYLMNLSEKEN